MVIIKSSCSEFFENLLTTFCIMKSLFCALLVEAMFFSEVEIVLRFFFLISFKFLEFNNSLVILTVEEREGRNNAYNIF